MKVREFLSLISLGKYKGILYRKGKLEHSSPIGGVLTLIFALFLFAYSIVVFKQIINRKNYDVESKSYLTSNIEELNTATLDRAPEIFRPVFFLFIPKNETCE